MAVCSLVEGDITLTGKSGLVARPVGDLVEALRQLGCQIEYADKEGFPPIIAKSGTIAGGTTRLSGRKTSQYFSSMTLAAPLAQKDVTIICTDDMAEKPYFDITIQMMELFGAKADHRDYREITVRAGQTYRATHHRVEGDWSSASFFMLAAAITGGRVVLKDLNRNSKQGDRLFGDYLQAMGCSVTWEGADLVVQGGPLKPITVNMEDTPDLVPPLAIAAAFAQGESLFTHVGHLRYKECNRLEAMKQELAKFGISCDYDQELSIRGNPKAMVQAAKRASTAAPISINCWNDHRIAMSFAIAGLALENVDITNTACVAKSFPDFWERLRVFY
jgi:3-phosphoshikimate 1-carboxyvinyltransferase